MAWARGQRRNCLGVMIFFFLGFRVLLMELGKMGKEMGKHVKAITPLLLELGEVPLELQLIRDSGFIVVARSCVFRWPRVAGWPY